MAKREAYRNRIELLQGTLDMLILRTLSWGPRHGYGIGNAIRAGSAYVLRPETGSLYPALHRLEKQGWVKAEWRQSENRQRAKYYSLTPSIEGAGDGAAIKYRRVGSAERVAKFQPPMRVEKGFQILRWERLPYQSQARRTRDTHLRHYMSADASRFGLPRSLDLEGDGLSVGLAGRQFRHKDVANVGAGVQNDACLIVSC
jgi:PadR family transcriptional regulator, regulatory protein PadR